MKLYCPECRSTYDDSVSVCPDDGTRLYRLDPADDPLIGAVLDERFRIDWLIGQGGMGAVYRGLQLSVGRQVAIKVLRPEFIDREVALERFFREAKLISGMSHPNIVRLVEFGQDKERDLLYLVMELVDGTDLSGLLRQGRLRANFALEVAYQVLGALTEPHAADIIHRDLKPDNLLLSARSDGALQVKVLDFGIARALQRNTRLTQTGMICGTPAYMAPEQSRDKPVDARTDLYSLGVILYEMLAGKPPFMGQSSLQIMLKHIQQEPRPLRDVLPQGALPEDIEQLVYDLMAKDAGVRPRSARVVRDRIDALRAQLDLAPVRLDTERDRDVMFEPFILPAMPTSDELERGDTLGLVKETDLFERAAEEAGLDEASHADTVAEHGPTAAAESGDLLDELDADTEHDQPAPTTPMQQRAAERGESGARKERVGVHARVGGGVEGDDELEEKKTEEFSRTRLSGGQTGEVEASTELPARQRRPGTQTRPGAHAGLSNRALIAIAMGAGVAVLVVAGALWMLLSDQTGPEPPQPPAAGAPVAEAAETPPATPAAPAVNAEPAEEAPAAPATDDAGRGDAGADATGDPAATGAEAPEQDRPKPQKSGQATSAPAEQPAKEKPAEKQLASEKPAEKQPAREKPAEKQPADDGATADPALDEQFQDLMNAE